jgi:type VI secretion system protein ImpB
MSENNLDPRAFPRQHPEQLLTAMPKPSESSTKFIERNRAPRVHIEYELFVDGAQKKIELPFVMGVMADLSGQSQEPLPPVAERKFREVDMDNFDKFMKDVKPRVAFAVPNALSENEGERLPIDITFDKMDDFSPEAIARKVEPLRKLLEARTQLSNLLTYMDGRVQAENLIEQLLADPALMKSVTSSAAPPEEE